MLVRFAGGARQSPRHCASGESQLTAGRQISAVVQRAALANAMAVALPSASGPSSVCIDEALQPAEVDPAYIQTESILISPRHRDK